MIFSHKRGIVHIMNLNELTQLIRQEIHRQYRSVRQFALQAGIPLSTVVTALNNDLKGSSYEIVVAMCKVLDIQAVTSDLSVFLDRSRRELLEGTAAWMTWAAIRWRRCFMWNCSAAVRRRKRRPPIPPRICRPFPTGCVLWQWKNRSKIKKRPLGRFFHNTHRRSK